MGLSMLCWFSKMHQLKSGQRWPNYLLVIFLNVLSRTKDVTKLLGILLSCAGFEDVELVAMATAKLHALIQTRHMSDPEEAAYLLCYLDTIVQNSLKGTQPEHYSFVLPVMKALLARISPTLALSTRLPTLPDTQAGPSFFERFQAYAQTPEWRALIDDKVGPFYTKNCILLLQQYIFISIVIFLTRTKVLIN